MKKFRFGVRELKVEKNIGSVEIKLVLKSDIIDGLNVRKTHRLIKFSEIENLLFKVRVGV